MNSFSIQLPQTSFIQNPKTQFKSTPKPLLNIISPPKLTIKICSSALRGGPRRPLWKSRVLSPESMQAVQALKLSKSKSPQKLQQTLITKLTRLLKTDLLDTLTELKRQNECILAHKVFTFIRNEIWYKPDIALYCDMILMFGKNEMVSHAEEVFDEMVKEGLARDTRSYSEMIGVYLRVDDVAKAMEMYEEMKECGCVPDKLTLTILIRNLEKAGEEEVVVGVKKDCLKYVEYPEKFLEEVAKKYPKRRSLRLL